MYMTKSNEVSAALDKLTAMLRQILLDVGETEHELAFTYTFNIIDIRTDKLGTSETTLLDAPIQVECSITKRKLLDILSEGAQLSQTAQAMMLIVLGTLREQLTGNDKLEQNGIRT